MGFMYNYQIYERKKNHKYNRHKPTTANFSQFTYITNVAGLYMFVTAQSFPLYTSGEEEENRHKALI